MTDIQLEKLRKFIVVVSTHIQLQENIAAITGCKLEPNAVKTCLRMANDEAMKSIPNRGYLRAILDTAVELMNDPTNNSETFAQDIIQSCDELINQKLKEYKNYGKAD